MARDSNPVKASNRARVVKEVRTARDSNPVRASSPDRAVSRADSKEVRTAKEARMDRAVSKVANRAVSKAEAAGITAPRSATNRILCWIPTNR